MSREKEEAGRAQPPGTVAQRRGGRSVLLESGQVSSFLYSPFLRRS